jgi:hypothetical protein
MKLASKNLLWCLPLSALLFAGVAQADWKQQAREMAKKRAQQAAAEKLGLPTTSPAGAKVYLISPKDGEEVTGTFTVRFGLKGMGIAPAGVTNDNTGHHHLLIDTDIASVDLTKSLPATDKIRHYGGGQTEVDLSLPAGKHTLQLVLGDYKHQPFYPGVQSEKITVTVK